MLSDAEQRRLAQIERALFVEDPAFVRQFGGERASRERHRWRRVFLSVGLVIALAVMVGAGIAGSLAATLLSPAILTITIAVWIVTGRKGGGRATGSGVRR